MSDIKALEHSTLIVPYESVNRSFRNAQKIIDREVSHVSVTNEKVKKLSSKNNVKISQTRKELDDVISKLEFLKNKSQDSIATEIMKLANCQSRVEYLKEQTAAKRNIIWKKDRLDRMMIDYFLRSGYYDTAVKYAESSEVKAVVDVDLFMVAREVESNLRKKNSSACLQWCHQNKSKLKKLLSTLELNIRIQEFVELIKSEKRLDAVAYARQYLSSSSGESFAVPDMQKTVMTLLAFKPDTQIKKYRDLFEETRWDLLVDQFRRENFALHQLNNQSMLEIVLQCGLASMKTPHCFHEEEKSQECPVCNRLFNELAKPLPFAHSSQSRLLCHVSGEPLNENNQPLMLPNGHVYGEVSLKRLAGSNTEGNIMCPRTLQVFKLSDAKKIYIM